MWNQHQPKGAPGLWCSKVSVSLKVFQRWHSTGADSCDSWPHITHFEDFVFHIFPRGCPVESWQFLFFSFASSFVHFVTIALPFGEPVGLHCLHPFLLHTSFPMSVFPHAQYHYSHTRSTTEQCSHQGFWKREREGEENPSFFKRKFLKPQRNRESPPRANSSTAASPC